MRQNSKKQELRRLMGEANVLPPKNRQRSKIESAITDVDWAQKEWKLLQKEKHVLQKTVGDVQIPVNLQQKLMQIPQQVPTKRRYVYVKLTAAAAAILVVLTFLLLPQRNITTKDLVYASAKWHMQPNMLDIETQSRDELREYFVNKSGFEPVWKKVDDRFSLQGGKVHTLSQKSVLCSSWRTSIGSCILVQFKAEDFDLPDQLKKEVWAADHPLHGKFLAEGNCLCIVWIKNGFGHVWVVKDSPQARNFFRL
ncbi:hypothetical protein [Candidatus Uabimicrobium amorphum]|uniref:Uncharacterized protein n=1 Tax=Uabimicrobium amorphum TaxID=2596890 RepID=A0A5S9F2I7_UABAM|nr:hypothetical protein [Candidatus Uabimicrobium amorphum]BBM83646.1 hypothetical protein UABAM_01999 [Candidatus Uabimicrobium amorphum]